MVGQTIWNNFIQCISTATNALITHKADMPCYYKNDSTNIVYLIHCQEFPDAKCIGKTGVNFRYRFNNHTQSIIQIKFLPLSLIFNANDHDIIDLNVCILKAKFKDNKHRKLTELQFIINFETNKFWLNKDISCKADMILVDIKDVYFIHISSYCRRYAFPYSQLSPFQL